MIGDAARQRHGRLWEVGQAGRRVWIADDWRVLDVGSGHHPHPRADTLLERFPDDNGDRSGASIVRDPRLVVGDAQAMPFGDRQFDYVIASHIAEHVEDPGALCRELVRVAKGGYIETPGWLGDMLLRESFHRWRVRRDQQGLYFDAVVVERPLGTLADAVYALTYMGQSRPGHRTWVPRRLLGRGLAKIVRMGVGRVLLLPVIRGFFYLEFEWRDRIDVDVR